MPRKVSDLQKQEILDSFENGENIKEISKSFNFTVSTITRQLKSILGEKKFLEIKDLKSKNLDDLKQQNKQFKSNLIQKEKLESPLEKTEINFVNKESFNNSEFFEIVPLQDQIDLEKQKNLTSKPIEKFTLPDLAFMVVDKNIELEPKLLSEYPEWSFLPSEDLNRTTLEIFSDNKSAKRKCSKNQKIIKVTNPKVFIIASEILKRKGITMLILDDNLLNL